MEGKGSFLKWQKKLKKTGKKYQWSCTAKNISTRRNKELKTMKSNYKIWQIARFSKVMDKIHIKDLIRPHFEKHNIEIILHKVYQTMTYHLWKVLKINLFN